MNEIEGGEKKTKAIVPEAVVVLVRLDNGQTIYGSFERL